MKTSTRTNIIIALSTIALWFACAAIAETPKRNIKVTNVSLSESIVSCKNGQAPKVKDVGDGVLLISCRPETQSQPETIR